MAHDIVISDAEPPRCAYRWQPFTYVALFVVSCSLILICAPGQVTVHDGCWGERWSKYEHGWPWVYLERWTFYDLSDKQNDIGLDAIGWCHASSWCLWEQSDLVAPMKFRPRFILLDVLCSGLGIVLASAAAQWWCRRRRLWQFSTRNLMACMLLCGASMGWWRSQHDRQVEVSRVAHKLEKEGMHFELGYVGPAWLSRLIGIGPLKVFNEPVAAKIFGDAGPLTRQLSLNRESFRRLKKVEFPSNAEIDAEAIENLSHLESIQTLSFFGSKIDDRALSRINSINALRQLDLTACSGMTDDGLAQLRANRRLENLWIFLTPLQSEQ